MYIVHAIASGASVSVDANWSLTEVAVLLCWLLRMS